jgi:enolase
MKITRIEALQIFDSRGNPTLEVQMMLENGVQGRGLVRGLLVFPQKGLIRVRDAPEKHDLLRKFDQAVP